MNPCITDPAHPSIIYYDSDYPSSECPVYPENFDEHVVGQGIADDINKYLHLTEAYGSNVLELCCGTGRVAIPLVKAGCTMTAVDISAPLLSRFKRKIYDSAGFDSSKLTIIKQDVTNLSIQDHKFDVVICAFNSLLCIPDFEMQQQTLMSAAKYLKPNGLLALDVWNPLVINLQGDSIPEFHFSRRRVDNGNHYTRYSAAGRVGIDQVQDLFGWYDEITPMGIVKRSSYELKWRLIFRYELELMLASAGFKISNIYGGNHNEPLQRDSMKMFVEAIRI